jgi:hypothetical protein
LSLYAAEEENMRYRVEIVEIASGKVVSIIGRNLSEKDAQRRICTGLSRCNTESYFVRDVEESAADIKETAKTDS